MTEDRAELRQVDPDVGLLLVVAGLVLEHVVVVTAVVGSPRLFVERRSAVSTSGFRIDDVTLRAAAAVDVRRRRRLDVVDFEDRCARARRRVNLHPRNAS